MNTQNILERIAYYQEITKEEMPYGIFQLHKTDTKGIYFTVTVMLAQTTTDEIQDLTAKIPFCTVEETISNGLYKGKFFVDIMTEDEIFAITNTPMNIMQEILRERVAQVKAEW